MLKNILSVKHSVHFDLTFAFLFDVKTSIFGCVHSVCFNTKCPCFIICENYFLFFTCFKRVNFLEPCCPILFAALDLLDQQTTQFDFSLSTLFVVFTSWDYQCNLYTQNNMLLQFLFQFLSVLFLIV